MTIIVYRSFSLAFSNSSYFYLRLTTYTILLCGQPQPSPRVQPTVSVLPGSSLNKVYLFLIMSRTKDTHHEVMKYDS